MARAVEGWKHFRDKRTGTYFVRFRHEGRRHNVATGERDSAAAAEAAARIYAEVVSGRWRQGKGLGEVGVPGLPFTEVAARWLADVESSLVPTTFTLYRQTYVKRHFAPFFATMDRLTTVSVEDYVSKRLREVKRQTLKAELSVLRRIATWARKRGYLARMPEIELPGRRALGTPASGSRKLAYQVFTASEMDRLLAELPESATLSNRWKHKGCYLVRARFVVAWETALRPATLNKLRAPDHYRKGAQLLLIENDTDKARFGRELPLSGAARAALDRVCPDVGLLFGEHDYRRILREAATRAGIEKHRADKISDYDFRHSRLTHLGQVTSNLSGVMYLAGHKQPATTARYMRPQKQAAEEVLRAAAVGTPLPADWLSSTRAAGPPGPTAPDVDRQRRLPPRRGADPRRMPPGALRMPATSETPREDAVCSPPGSSSTGERPGISVTP
jgi:integrase